MRSFSILVIAWFFACLVLVEGVELGEDLKGSGNCIMRLKLNRKDLRMKNRDSQQSMDADSPVVMATEHGSNYNNKNVHSKTAKAFRAGGAGYGKSKKTNSSKLDGLRKIQSNITAINAFYSMPSAIRPPKASKYPTSHYEVHLGVGPKLFQSGNSLWAYENECNPIAAETTVRLGGEDFHSKVYAAAVEANRQFSTINTIDPKALANAFYSLLYNSRELYSMMLVAYRCQNMVNAQDEDNVWLAPIFNDHENGVIDWRINSSLAHPTNEFPWASTQSQTYYDQLFNRQSTLCLSSPISNAHWAALWSQLSTFLRLPKGWKTWCRDMFMSVKYVQPTDHDVTPRFVVFWPDGQYAYFDMSSGSPVFKYDYPGTWFNLINDTNVPTFSVDWKNIAISQLEYALEQASAYFNIVMSLMPQLQIMFDLLGCTNDLDFDYTRDVLARTVYIDNSWDVSKLIYNSAVGLAAYVNSSNSYISTYHGECFENRTTAPEYWIRRDPVVSFQPTNNKLNVIQGPSVNYVDATTICEANMLLLYEHIAPLSFKHFYITNTGTVLNDYRYAKQPLIHLSDIVELMVSVGGYIGVTSLFCYRRFEWLMNIQGKSMVLPRSCYETRQYTGTSLAITQQGLTSGVFPIGVDANAQPRSYDVKTLADYLIPTLTAQEAISDYTDQLAK